MLPLILLLVRIEATAHLEIPSCDSGLVVPCVIPFGSYIIFIVVIIGFEELNHSNIQMVAETCPPSRI